MDRSIDEMIHILDRPELAFVCVYEPDLRIKVVSCEVVADVEIIEEEEIYE